MSKKLELITQLRSAIGAVGSEIPRLLAMYVSGDHIKGRSLWNSPIELALIMDIDPSASRFSRENTLLPEKDLAKLRDALADFDHRFIYRTAKLVEWRGTIALSVERQNPQVFYHQIAMGVLKGAKLYAAPDFMLNEFERDIQQHWGSDDKHQKAATEKMQGLFDLYQLPRLESLNLPRLDPIWIGETLRLLQNTLESTHDVRSLSFETFLSGFSYRNGARFSWRQTSQFVSDLSRHIISRHTHYQPNNYTQLFTHLADLGIVPHADIWGLTVICERPMLGPVRRVYGDEDVEAFCLLTEHITCADRFLVGMVRYVHQFSTENTEL